MAKRITRNYEVDGKDYIGNNYGNSRHTVNRTFKPVDELTFKDAGLDSRIKLGRVDLDKLNNARKIRVTITTVE
jgi:hypothetical protein